MLRILFWIALAGVTIDLAALSAHVLELPNDLGLPGDLWLAVQQRLYRGWGLALGPFEVRVAQVAHPVEAYAMRISAGGSTLAYSGDTGPCSALETLAADADVLLAEAAFVESVEHPVDLHMTGRDAAVHIRNTADPRSLILQGAAGPSPTTASAGSFVLTREVDPRAPSVVARYFPRYAEIYRRLGWTMFDSIDRVYVAEKLEKELGFVCRLGFGERLAELEREIGTR